MPWDPPTYNQFKSIRNQPFFDLVELVDDHQLLHCVDIGCGTGEQTSLLSKRFRNSSFLGIDSSKEMLAEATQFVTEKLTFQLCSIEEFAGSDSTWDLIFSNAALQWSDSHRELFPKLISKLTNSGQFAVQMPCQKENVLNKILLELVSEKKFSGLLNGFRRDSPLLEIDDYAQVMFDNKLTSLSISVKLYPLIASSEMDLYHFISGSALIPYMERLGRADQELLKAEFIHRIKTHFPVFPAIYSFKRLLLYGVKNG